MRRSDAAVIRKAFVMQLRAGQLDEYRRRHNPIWPELAAAFCAPRPN
jgi:L-rhamnose mutarotase